MAKIGRPRSTTPNDEELEILGQELVTWATEPTEEKRLHLKEWWCLEKGILKQDWDLMLLKPVFYAYYQQAQSAISKRYIDGTINSSIAHRFIRHYFPEIKQDENELLVFKSELARAEKEQSADENMKQMRACFSEIAKEFRTDPSSVSPDIRSSMETDKPLLD